MGKHLVVFVCTGNICRSPMAEYMVREALGTDTAWDVTSAGIMAGYGVPASSAAVHVLRERAIDGTPHLSRPITPELIDAATVIVVMTAAHRDQLVGHFPAAREKMFLLRSFDSAAADADVEDPIGLPADAYRRVRDNIDAAMPELVAFLRELESNGQSRIPRKI